MNIRRTTTFNNLQNGIDIGNDRKKIMKKLLVVCTLLSPFAGTAQAVTKSSGSSVGNYKPLAGTVTAEFGLSGGLLNSNVNLNNNAGLLRFRYFSSSDLAFRVGFAVNSASTTDNFYGGTNNADKGTRERQNTGVTINLGLEKHLTGTDRLSTYVGGDLLFALSSATEDWKNSNGTAYVQGLSRSIKGFNTVSGGTNASTSLGLRLVTGAEYYFVKNVYLGAEVGFGFLSSKFKDIEDETTTVSGTGVTTTVNNDVKSPGKGFEISPSVITGVRLGFQF